MNSDELVKIENLDLVLDTRQVLKNISLNISQNENIALIGPNGAGKSSLLKCLIKLHSATKGSISVCGQPISFYSQSVLVQNIAYLSQETNAFIPYTVREFVMFGRYPHLKSFGLNSEKDEEIVTEVLTETNCLSYAALQVSSLSSGERQRVFLAACLAQEAKMLLLDEPTTFLDPTNQYLLLDLLNKLFLKKKFSMLWVTHDINSALLNAQRIIALNHAEIIFDGKPEELLQSDIISKLYARKYTLMEHPTRGTPFIFFDSNER